jgi:hypothetical protein
VSGEEEYVVQGEVEDEVLSQAELNDLFGDSEDYDVVSEADSDLFAVACADLDFAGRYAYDPECDPPVDTFRGMWAQGERELELVDACEQRIGLLHAMQCRALARFAQLRPDENGLGISKYVAEEIGLAAKWTARWAGSRLALAFALADRLPGTLEALERGDVDLRRAQALADITRACPLEVARAVEDAVLPDAAGQNISELATSRSHVVSELVEEVRRMSKA